MGPPRRGQDDIGADRDLDRDPVAGSCRILHVERLEPIGRLALQTGRDALRPQRSGEKEPAIGHLRRAGPRPDNDLELALTRFRRA